MKKLLFLLLFVSFLSNAQTTPPVRWGLGTRESISTTKPLQFQAFAVPEGDSLGFFVYKNGDNSAASADVIIGPAPDYKRFIRRKISGAYNLPSTVYYNKSEVEALLGPKVSKGTLGELSVPIYNASNNSFYSSPINVGNGRVAINKINPEYQLDVNGNGRFTNSLKIWSRLDVDGASIGGEDENQNLSITAFTTFNGSHVGRIGDYVMSDRYMDITGVNGLRLNVGPYGLTDYQVIKIQPDEYVLIGPTGTANSKLDVQGDINADAGYKLGDNMVLSADGTSHRLIDYTGNAAITVGGTGAPENNYRNTTHYFKDRAGTTTFSSLSSSAFRLHAYTSPSAVTGTAVGLLGFTSNGTVVTMNPLSSSISGTTHTLPKFTSANVIGDSRIKDNGTVIELGTSKITSNGFGVGVTPVDKLTITGGGNLVNVSALTTYSAGNTSRIHFEELGTGQGNLNFYTYDGASGGGQRATILANGNIGIGTASPNQSLEVAKSGAVAIRLNNTAANVWDIENTSPAGALQFVRGGVNVHAFIDPTGNFGIGTVSPGEKLQVNGNGYFTGRIDAGGNVSANGDYLGVFGNSTDLRLNTNYGGVPAIQLVTGSKPLLFVLGNAEKARFNSNGYLGINTTTTDGQLHVKGANGDYLINAESTSGRLRVSGYLSSTGMPTIQGTTANGGAYAGLAMDATELNFFSSGVHKMNLTSGGMVIGSGTKKASAALDVQSTTGFFYPPIMTTTERNAQTPVDGAIFYNSTTGKFQGRAAGAWVDLH